MSDTSRRGFLGALAVSGATLAASRTAEPVKLGFADLKKDTRSPVSIIAISAIRLASARC